MSMQHPKLQTVLAVMAVNQSLSSTADRETFSINQRVQAKHSGFYQALAKGLYKAKVLHPKGLNWRTSYGTRFLELTQLDR